MATYYTPSNYGTKYYKSFTDERGVSVTLYIKQRGYSSTQYQIGRIQALDFQVQGNEEVTAPIVKTNLQITLLDDMYYPGVSISGTKYESRTYYRYGNWVEFYTPDSTKYLVELYYNGSAFWRGYITPDSYSESLDAIGSVTITARDNIGHMQDFDFDMTGNSSGLVKVTDLITQAFTKIAFPMDLTTLGFSTGDDKYLISEDGSYCLGDLYFNAAALEGETYLDALEDVLNSLGFCLRFVGYVDFYLTPLRAMPFCGYSESEAGSEQPTQELQFYGRRSGTRTFDPAYKQITENVNFEQEDEFSPDILFAKEGTIAQTSTKKFVPYFWNTGATDPGGDKYAVAEVPLSGYVSASVHWITGAASNNGWTLFPRQDMLSDEEFVLQDQTIELEGESARDYLFLAANLGESSKIPHTLANVVWASTSHGFARKVKSTQVSVVLHFAAHPMGFGRGDGTSKDYNKLGVFTAYNLARIECFVSYSKNGTSYYWDGNYWRSKVVTYTIEYDPLTSATEDVGFDLLECDEIGADGVLTITLTHIRYQCIGYSFNDSKPYVLSWKEANGVYARLKSITFSSTSARRAKSDTVTTICNTSYNVRCERNPLLGFLPISVNFVDPINYKNAFFVYDSSSNVQFAPYRWRWNTDQSVLPFPVRVHQQLLMYHYTTEEILEGDCGIYKPSGVSRVTVQFDAVNEYKSKSYLLKSCTFNLIKGRFTTAEFRSYKNYTDLWDGTETYNNEQLT